MNCVDITGRLREKIDEIYRYFEYELPYLEEPKEGPNLIVIKYWTNLPKSRLVMLNDNARVIIHGHLDRSENFATILVVEQIEVIH